jgi:hypothetical protein
MLTPENFKMRAAEQLQAAVKAMREACDRAERDAIDGDSNACQRVLHSLMWGMANASSSIETAMANVEDAHIIAAVQNQRQDILDERDACAKVCEDHKGIKIQDGPRLPPDGSTLANAIRLRPAVFMHRK